MLTQNLFHSQQTMQPALFNSLHQPSQGTYSVIWVVKHLQVSIQAICVEVSVFNYTYMWIFDSILQKSSQWSNEPKIYTFSRALEHQPSTTNLCSASMESLAEGSNMKSLHRLYLTKEAGGGTFTSHDKIPEIKPSRYKYCYEGLGS